MQPRWEPLTSVVLTSGFFIETSLTITSIVFTERNKPLNKQEPNDHKNIIGRRHY